MRTLNLLLGMLIASFSGSVAAIAGEPIELKVQDSGIGIVQVDGPDGGNYTEVLNDTIEYSVSVRGATPHNAIEGTSQLKLRVVPHGEDREVGQISEVWKTYKLSMPYHDLPTFGSFPISPIKLCKQRLSETSGAAREDFMNKGTTFTQSVLWLVRGSVNWDRYPGQTDKDESALIHLTLKIQCLALNRIVSSLQIEPAKVTQLGKFLCPMELKLHGFMSSRDEFSGKSLFVGPHYLSAITPLQLEASDTRHVGHLQDELAAEDGFTGCRAECRAEEAEADVPLQHRESGRQGGEIGGKNDRGQLQEDQGECADRRRWHDRQSRELRNSHHHIQRAARFGPRVAVYLSSALKPISPSRRCVRIGRASARQSGQGIGPILNRKERVMKRRVV